MSVSSDEEIIRKDTVESEDFDETEIFNPSGVSIRHLIELWERIEKNEEGNGVFLKVLRNDVNITADTIARKGTTIKVKSKYDRSGIIVGTSPQLFSNDKKTLESLLMENMDEDDVEVNFKPKDVVDKNRKNWTLFDVYYNIIKPQVDNSSGSCYIDVLKKRSGHSTSNPSFSKPYKSQFLITSPKLTFCKLIKTLIKMQKMGINYIWLKEFCISKPFDKKIELFLFSEETKGYKNEISKFDSVTIILENFKFNIYNPLKYLTNIYFLFCSISADLQDIKKIKFEDDEDEIEEKRRNDGTKLNLIFVEEFEKYFLEHDNNLNNILNDINLFNIKYSKYSSNKNIKQNINKNLMKKNKINKNIKFYKNLNKLLDPKDIKLYLTSKQQQGTLQNHDHDLQEGNKNDREGEESGENGFELVNEILKDKLMTWLLKYCKNLIKPILRVFYDDTKDISSITNQGIMLISIYAKILQYLGSYNESKEYFKITLILSKIKNDSVSIEYSKSLNDIGDIYKDLGLLESSLEFYVTSLNIKKTIFKGLEVTMSNTLTNISLIFEEQGRIDDAITCQTKALNLDKTQNYENSNQLKEIAIAVDLTNLGSMYGKKEEFDKSLNLLNQALELYLKNYKTVYHPKIATVYNNLAAIHSDEEHFKKAIQVQRKALKIDKQIYGKYNIEVANDLVNLATYLSLYYSPPDADAGGVNEISEDERENGLKESLRLFFEAIEIQIRSYGIEHGNIASNLNNLAFVLLDLKEKEKAFYYGQKAVSILRKVYGEDHPYTKGAIQTWGDGNDEDLEDGSQTGIIIDKDGVKNRKEGGDVASKVILNAVGKFRTKEDVLAFLKEEDPTMSFSSDEEDIEIDQNKALDVDKQGRRRRKKRRKKSLFHGMEKLIVEEKEPETKTKGILRKSQKFTTTNVADMLENRKSMKRAKSKVFKSGYGSEFNPEIDWESMQKEEEQQIVEKEEEQQPISAEKSKKKPNTRKDKKKTLSRNKSKKNKTIKKKKKKHDPSIKEYIPRTKDFRALFKI